jgi:tetratricopeptide (TPR) repeat protein
MTQEERIIKLNEFLQDNPNDTFSLFAMAMELKSLNRCEEALGYLDKVLTVDPNYVPGYFQKAEILIELSRRQEAKQVLLDGIPKAVDAGQFHIRDRMQETINKIK